MGSSKLQVARRALVILIKALAAQYQIVVSVSRDAADKDVTAAFKRVALKVHPDKGGNEDDFKKLQEARQHWDEIRLGKQGNDFLGGPMNRVLIELSGPLLP